MAYIGCVVLIVIHSGCRLIYLIILCCGKVVVSVECQPFWSDGNAPVVMALRYEPPCHELMVGSRILFIVTSKSRSYWPGGLSVVIGGEPPRFLRARDYNDLTLDWAGSRSAQAGPDGHRVLSAGYRPRHRPGPLR